MNKKNSLYIDKNSLNLNEDVSGYIHKGHMI